jgi:prophage antirepressor-like protein
MNAVQLLNYETNQIRMTEVDGEPVWIAKDVCDTLDIKNSRDAVSTLDEDEKGVATTDTLGGSQSVQVINESGLYNLIFQSRKPEAKKFKRWVTHEVLPQIRRTGIFMAAGMVAPEYAELAALEYRAAALRKRLEARELECKAKLVYQLEGAMPIMDWIRENYPALESKQVANLSRAIKRAIVMQLKKPVGAQRKTDGHGNKVMAAAPADIEAAVAILKETRAELLD